jgi:acetaldehyde dehydrogenase
MTERVQVAVLGTGNIGTDLLLKLLRRPGLDVALFAGVDPASAGIARARSLGVPTSTAGIDAVLADDGIRLVFDASSAKSHRRHAPLLKEAGKLAVDLTPAAVGPLVVPSVNLEEHIQAPNVNMITCGGQATIPIVRALHDTAPLRYAEMVSTIASRSAGVGTRQNIDEFTQTTARALECVGGAARGKAIIILNPAEPPILMGHAVMAIPESREVDEAAIGDAVDRMVADVAQYVPGYRLKAPVSIDEQDTPWGRMPVVIVLLQVEGAGDFLPRYAGNLDIMTSAASRVGELMALAGRREALST